MVSQSRVDQSTLGGLQRGTSFLRQTIVLSALVTLLVFSSTFNNINSICLFLILFAGHHRLSPGWAISSQIRWDCYADFDWKQWEKHFGHFM